jgi:hypothetical protein
MTSSQDRWVYPADGADPRDADGAGAAADRAADRPVGHDQEAARNQVLSADRPGVDPSDRERDVEGGLPTAD